MTDKETGIPASNQEVSGSPLPVDWIEKFKREYDLSKIPEAENRGEFEYFLERRAGVREFVDLLPEEKWDKGINKGDPPHTDIIHIILNLQKRIIALREGHLDNWKPDADEFSKLMVKPKSALLELLDATAISLYVFLSSNTVLTNRLRIINLPKNKTKTVAQALRDATDHELLHNGINIGHGDNLEVPRPQAISKKWGGGKSQR